MKLIKKLFSKKIYYSCVIDDHSKYYWQGFIFITSLLEIALVRPEYIFIHMTGRNAAFEMFLNDKGINIIFIEKWGDKKYCNKLQQIESLALQKADYVFLCDVDIAILEDISKLLDLNRITGKIVDLNNPELDKLQSIFNIFNCQIPNINYETLNNLPTLDGNFNGGLYGIQGKHLKAFGKQWKYWADKLLNSDQAHDILGRKSIHIDQISFCIALNEMQLPYKMIDIIYNCPTHIKNIELLRNKIANHPLVLHFHSKLTPTGLLEQTGLEVIDNAIKKVNVTLQKEFINELFWNFRYTIYPELGSGIGSRGDIALYKLNLLKSIGVESYTSTLDVGCGDLDIIKSLNLSTYTGVDISGEALKQASKKFTDSQFYHYSRDKNRIPTSDLVLCLDVLIHQSSREMYDSLIAFLIEKTENRLVVAGYRNIADKSHMCFFYEDIVISLKKKGLFKYIFNIGSYRGIDVIIADKYKLGQQDENPQNDIENKDIEIFLKQYSEIDQELLFESVAISRGSFGWFTKHLPRSYEYPWLLEQLGNRLKGFRIVDFGAGITPMPILLSLRGANVLTIDNSSILRGLPNIRQANEWGFFDYSTTGYSIKSFNETLTEETFANDSIDIWYSISVIEHIPAQLRRSILVIMANTLNKGGQLLLTVDLEKNSQLLWNKSSGQQVEPESQHGTIETVVSELKELGFLHINVNIISMPTSERVDIATISARAKQ